MNQEKRKQITVYDLLLPSIKDTEARKLALSKYECVLPTQKEQRIFMALAKFQSALSMAVHFKLDTDRYNVVLNEFDKLDDPCVKIKVLESWLSHSNKLGESALQCEDGLYQLLNEMCYAMFEQTFTSEAIECVKKFACDHCIDLESGHTADVVMKDQGIESIYAKDPEAFLDADINCRPGSGHYAHLTNICKTDGTKPEYCAWLDIHDFLMSYYPINHTELEEICKAVKIYNGFSREDKLIALKSYNARVIRSQPQREAFCRAVETAQEYAEQKMEDTAMINYEDFSEYEIKLLGISLMDFDAYNKAVSESEYSCYCHLESHVVWALDRLHKLVEKVTIANARGNMAKVCAAETLAAIVTAYDQMPVHVRKAVVLNWWSLMHLCASEAVVPIPMRIQLFSKSVNVVPAMEHMGREYDTREQDHLSESLEENEKPCHCHSNEEAACGEKCECKNEESAYSIGEQLVSAAKRRSVNMSLVVKGIAYVYMHIDTMPSKLVETADDLDYTLSNSHDEINNIGQNIFFQIALLGTLLCLSVEGEMNMKTDSKKNTNVPTEEKKEKPLQHIVDRYGIIPYPNTAALIVNKEDLSKAKKALDSNFISNRVFEGESGLSDLVGEAVAEIALASQSENEALAIQHREQFGKELNRYGDILEEIIHDNLDYALDFIAELAKKEE